MIRKIIIALSISLIFFGIYCVIYPPAGSGYLFINMKNDPKLPKDFRIIPELRASGGGQYSEESLKKIIEALPSKNIEVIDAREESHGFINGIAFGFYAENNCGNMGKSLEEIEADEQNLLHKLSKQRSVALFTQSYIVFPITVKTVESEKELTARYGLRYRRFPLTDHRRPPDAQVDAFITLVKELPEDLWIYVHCLAGRGRTTSLLAMLDMMRNSKRFTLEEIAKRQEDFGGLNILKPASKTRWKYPLILERIEFFKLFYRYCQEVPNFDIPWSEWVKKLESK
jgi:hypothetical protein